MQVKKCGFALHSQFCQTNPFLVLNGFVNPGGFLLDAAWLHQENIIYFTAKTHLFCIGQTVFKEQCNA